MSELTFEKLVQEGKKELVIKRKAMKKEYYDRNTKWEKLSDGSIEGRCPYCGSDNKELSSLFLISNQAPLNCLGDTHSEDSIDLFDTTLLWVICSVCQFQGPIPAFSIPGYSWPETIKIGNELYIPMSLDLATGIIFGLFKYVRGWEGSPSPGTSLMKEYEVIKNIFTATNKTVLNKVRSKLWFVKRLKKYQLAILENRDPFEGFPKDDIELMTFVDTLL